MDFNGLFPETDYYILVKIWRDFNFWSSKDQSLGAFVLLLLILYTMLFQFGFALHDYYCNSLWLKTDVCSFQINVLQSKRRSEILKSVSISR